VSKGESSQGWRFGLQRADDRHRDPTVGEYFRTDADSLIREALQNSLDAAVGDGPVRVKLHLSQRGLAVSDELDGLFVGLDEHLMAAAGLAHVEPSLPDRCRYLTVEDFGTRGLRGDPDECFDGARGRDFYHFFRADGRSGKPQGKRGSWGYGKYTFVKASRINTFFGVTVPDDGNRGSALGQAVLTNHEIEGRHFKPDGWWGRVAVQNEGEFTSPFAADSIEYRQLCEVFGLARRANEPGLSLVVPFLDEQVTAPAVVSAVLENYLPSLVMGHLEVEVTSDTDDAVEMTAASVRQVLKTREFNEELPAILRMSEQLMKEPDVVLSTPVTSPSWAEVELAEGDRDRIEELLAADATFVVRVPLVVKRKQGGVAQETYLDVCCLPSDGERTRPIFFRSGIRVTDAQRLKTVRAQTMVWIGDEPLVEMLGLAETPAHTNWDDGSDRFKNQYVYGRQWVSFVRQAPIKLLDIASAGRPAEDRRTLSAFFPVPKERSAASGSGRDSTEGKSTRPTVDVGPKPVPVRISPLRSNGFRVRFDEEVELGDELDIVVAYDVLNGDPFKKWSPLDFDLGALSSDSEGLEVLEMSGQRIRVRVLGSDAEIDVWGFDRWLDVIVRCEAAA